MQSTSKQKTINYQQEQKYDLPFYSREEKDRRVVERLLANNSNPLLTGHGDGNPSALIAGPETANTRPVQAHSGPSEGREEGRDHPLAALGDVESAFSAGALQIFFPADVHFFERIGGVPDQGALPEEKCEGARG